jgi:hypothetical protein
MADLKLPATVRVRISSESAEGIGLTPVVAQDMPLLDLIGHVLGVSGKDASRVCEVLSRGSLIVGGSRFRWAALDCTVEEMLGLFGQFPDSDPSRSFEPARCRLAIFRSGARSVVLERQAGQKRRMFRSRSFWDELLAMAKPAYAEYSYRERADQYVWHVESQAKLAEAARLLAWSSYESELRSGGYSIAELYCDR